MSNSLTRIAGLAAVVAGSISAQALPNIVSVVETGGDTDRPSAKVTGMTFNIENPTGTVLVPNYTVGTFGENAKAMTDRTHDYNSSSTTPSAIAGTVTVSLPSYLVGQEYIMIANNDRDNAGYQLKVTLAQPSIVYLLIDNRLGDGDNTNPPDFSTLMTWVQTDLYIPFKANGNHWGNPAFPDDVGIDESADNTINQLSSVYAKLVPAGELTLGDSMNSGRNMYGVVVAAIPEPGTATLVLLGGGALAWISRRRRS